MHRFLYNRLKWLCAKKTASTKHFLCVVCGWFFLRQNVQKLKKYSDFENGFSSVEKNHVIFILYVGCIFGCKRLQLSNKNVSKPNWRTKIFRQPSLVNNKMLKFRSRIWCSSLSRHEYKRNWCVYIKSESSNSHMKTIATYINSHTFHQLFRCTFCNVHSKSLVYKVENHK